MKSLSNVVSTIIVTGNPTVFLFIFFDLALDEGLPLVVSGPRSRHIKPIVSGARLLRIVPRHAYNPQSSKGSWSADFVDSLLEPIANVGVLLN